MKKYKILAVEDEATTQTLLRQCLTSLYELVVSPNLGRAKEVLTRFKPDLILLDLYLPDGNGFEFFDFLKKNPQTHRIPVIFLSLESGVEVKVKSFTIGAYDYITKPFNSTELVARIDAHCARAAEVLAALYTPEVFANLSFDREALQVYHVDKQGHKQLIDLSPTEFKLLQCFMSHIGKTLSRELIAKEVWNKTYFQSRTIDRHISSLRKKLGATGTCLKTISHEGYLLSLEDKE